MSNITSGEQWKMSLLSGETKPSDAVDMLLDNITMMTDRDVAKAVLPMAELRASQISRGLDSTDEATIDEAKRMEHRYIEGDAKHPSEYAAAKDAVQKEAGDKNELTRAVASNWVEKLITNDRVGEMEKELKRTVDTYKTEKQENRLTLRHSQPVQSAAR